MARTKSEVQEERGKLGEKIKEYAKRYNPDKGWEKAEDEATWKTLNADFDKLNEEYRKLDTAQQVDSRVKEIDDIQSRTANPGPKPGMENYGFDSPESRDRMNNPGNDRRQHLPDEERRMQAFRAWGRIEKRPLTDDDRQSLVDCRYLDSNEVSFAPLDVREVRDIQQDRGGYLKKMESRALSGVTLSAGGALVPQTFVRMLEVNRIAWGGMLQAAGVINSSDGGMLTLPTADDTANIGRRIGESAERTTSGSDPAFGAVTWSAYGYTTDIIKVPYELLDDSAFAIEPFLADAFGMRNGRKQNYDFTKGVGASGPKGIEACLSAATNLQAASATAIGYADIVKLRFLVNAAYRAGAVYMCNEFVLQSLRLLLDSQNRPLWTAGVDIGGLDRIEGVPVILNYDMDNTMSSGKITLYYGQLSAYKVRWVGQKRAMKLDQRYAEFGQVGFCLNERCDGNLLTASTTNTPVKYLYH